MKNVTIIYILVAIILIPSCAPDQFRLNRADKYIVNGLILSGLDGVDVTGYNALALHPGGMAALRSDGLTQLSAEFTVRIKSGEGLRFALRTVSNNYPGKPGITFDYSTTGSKLEENGVPISKNSTVKAVYDKTVRILIRNDGDKYSIYVDCDEAFNNVTKLAATEYVILEALPGTEAIVSGINFAYILEEE